MGLQNDSQRHHDAKPDEHAAARGRRRPLELAVADSYRRQGYTVVRLPDDGRDRDYDGIDLLLRRDGKLFVVACRDRLPPSFHHQIQSLQQQLPRLGAHMLIVASPGTFDAHSRECADSSPQLQLVDGKLLRVLLGDARMEALARELDAARAAYPPPPPNTPSVARRKYTPGLAVMSCLLLVLVVVLGWLASRHRGDGADTVDTGTKPTLSK